MTLKIGIEANGLLGSKPATGVQRYVAALINKLATRAPDEDLKLYLYFAYPPAPALQEKGQSLFNLRPSQFIKWRIAPFARGWQRLGMGIAMQLDGLDVFHFPAPLMARYCPKPSVVTFHDLAALSLGGQYTLKEQRYLPDALDAGRRATAIIADSGSTRGEIVRHLQRSDVTVVHLGVDTTFFSHVLPETVEAVRSKLNVNQYILCVGTLQTRKNHLRLIEAFEHIQDKIPHSLVIVGRDGSGADAIRQYLTEHPNPRITLVGFIEDSMLAALYTGADVMALPSLWEGFGLPVIEAMACGTPVLTSNVASLAEIAGDSALLVNPYDSQDIADGLFKLLMGTALRERLIEAGYHRAADFSWENTTRRTLDVYRQTVRHK